MQAGCAVLGSSCGGQMRGAPVDHAHLMAVLQTNDQLLEETPSLLFRKTAPPAAQALMHQGACLQCHWLCYSRKASVALQLGHNSTLLPQDYLFAAAAA